MSADLHLWLPSSLCPQECRGTPASANALLRCRVNIVGYVTAGVMQAGAWTTHKQNWDLR